MMLHRCSCVCWVPSSSSVSIKFRGSGWWPILASVDPDDSNNVVAAASVRKVGGKNFMMIFACSFLFLLFKFSDLYFVGDK